MNNTQENNSLRVIKTARTKEAINNAVKNGYKALVKVVKPSSEIHSKFSVIQNKATGEIMVLGDYRMNNNFGPKWEQVIGWTEFYPNKFPNPYAAYLIPKDIKIGERVIVADLIEDYVGMTWNQGDNFRLTSCEAVWDGSNLVIQYDPKTNCRSVIG
jgi:hypothetical protein